MKMAQVFLKKNWSCTLSAEELGSFGFEGLRRAAASFDARKGFRFSTYASRCIYNSILAHVSRKKNRSAGSVSLSVCANKASPDNHVDRIEMAEQVEKLLGALDARSKGIVSMFYIHGMTHREIAHSFRLSRGRVQQIMSEAMNMLRREFV